MEKNQHDARPQKKLARTLLLPFALCVCSVITMLSASALVTRKAYKQAETDMAIAIEKQAASVKTMLKGQYDTLRSQAVAYSSYGVSSNIRQKSEWLSAIKKVRNSHTFY